jgi:hypothetical protein
MDSVYEGARTGRFGTRPQSTTVPDRGNAPRANSVTASQARAASRREARRDEQAVAAWLRELAGRSR